MDFDKNLFSSCYLTHMIEVSKSLIFSGLKLSQKSREKSLLPLANIKYRMQ